MITYIDSERALPAWRFLVALILSSVLVLTAFEGSSLFVKALEFIGREISQQRHYNVTPLVPGRKP